MGIPTLQEHGQTRGDGLNTSKMRLSQEVFFAKFALSFIISLAVIFASGESGWMRRFPSVSCFNEL